MVFPLEGGPTTSTPRSKGQPSKKSLSPQPGTCRGMRYTKAVMSRKERTWPPSATAVPHTPTRRFSPRRT